MTKNVEMSVIMRTSNESRGQLPVKNPVVMNPAIRAYQMVDFQIKMNLSDPSIPRIPYQHTYPLPFEQGISHTRVNYLMQTYWHHTFTVSILYIVVIRWLEYWMAKRPAYDLRTALIFWNGALAIFSIMGAIRTTEEFMSTTFNEGLYKSVCYVFDQTSVTAHWFLFFAISKLVEFGDTIFIALRKRPLTFLHCYHHCSVLIYTFHSGAEHLASGRWFMWMNFIAHSVMYTYFCAVSAGIKVPRKLAKCVTLIQITQMILGIGVSLSVFAIKSLTSWRCHQSYTNLYLSFFIYVSYAILFIRFFINAYSTNKKVIESDKKK
uniref:Elongation of very long chain fatty acids protein n=3 Tax=Acrobeloides nanus TaxID=290746 RepID=A0A914DAS2_9BILA